MQAPPSSGSGDSSTLIGEVSEICASDLRVPALTILAHPSTERVGERVLLPALASGRPVALSRLTPLFSHPDSCEARALESLHLSRRPISFSQGSPDGSIHLTAPPEGTRVEIFGTETETVFGPADLARGVPLLLAGRVALLLQTFPTTPHACEGHGLVGESAEISMLRAAITRSAGLSAPVLLRGETGTGKELVARAIHQASPRRKGPYLTVNVGAIPPTLAASELFGAARGSFTGADRRREGYFERADGGTLFLDEIGEAPQEVQALLLRALENGEIQSVGADAPRRVDVRVIAATDADLEKLVADKRFRSPLLHRLQGDVIRLPALRARRDDIGRLLIHFLRAELEAVGQEHRLDDPGPHGRPWLPARLVARLAAADWPGNVRELRNVARRLASSASAGDTAALFSELEANLATGALSVSPKEAVKPRTRAFRAMAEVTEDEVLAALEAEQFNFSHAANRLGISRTALYVWVERHPGIRKASTLTAEEISTALEGAEGDLEGAARQLGVSPHGLKIRRTELGVR
jgi:two-component system, NtrC family, nitrogen regulation response regulator GlnG